MDEDIAFELGIIIWRILVKLDDENYNRVKDDLFDLRKEVLKISEVQYDIERELRENKRDSQSRV
jgi:hypothetical protein